MKKKIFTLLYQHYTTPPESLFPKFRLGAVIFFWGAIVIYIGSQFVEPSLLQEIITLVGLLLIAVGFFTALMVQVRMVIGRILRVFFD